MFIQIPYLIGRKLWSTAHIHIGLITQHGILPSLDRREENVRILHTHLSTERDNGFGPLGTPFGCHQDDTIGRTRTIDGRTTGILQHRDAFNVVRVQVIQRRRTGNQTVNHNQRVIVSHGTHTTDIDVQAVVIRIHVLALNDQVGRCALQGLGRIRHRTVFKHLITDLIDRTRDALPRAGTVTNHHDLIQFLGVFAQHNLYMILALRVDLLGQITDVRDIQQPTFGHLQSEITIQIRDRSLCSTGHQHIGTNDRFTRLIHNLT